MKRAINSATTIIHASMLTSVKVFMIARTFASIPREPTNAIVQMDSSLASINSIVMIKMSASICHA